MLADLIILALYVLPYVAGGAFGLGVTIVICKFFSNWASRLIADGPLAMWGK